jgi:hypothetical protein
MVEQLADLISIQDMKTRSGSKERMAGQREIAAWTYDLRFTAQHPALSTQHLMLG